MVILLRRLILNIVILLVILRHQPQGINEAGNEVVVSKIDTPFRKRYKHGWFMEKAGSEKLPAFSMHGYLIAMICKDAKIYHRISYSLP